MTLCIAKPGLHAENDVIINLAFCVPLKCSVVSSFSRMFRMLRHFHLMIHSEKENNLAFEWIIGVTYTPKDKYEYANTVFLFTITIEFI